MSIMGVRLCKSWCTAIFGIYLGSFEHIPHMPAGDSKQTIPIFRQLAFFPLSSPSIPSPHLTGLLGTQTTFPPPKWCASVQAAPLYKIQQPKSVCV